MISAMSASKEFVSFALQTMLLSLYEGVMICDSKANVIWNSPGTLDKHPIPTSTITDALKKNTKILTVQENWEGNSIIVTALPAYLPSHESGTEAIVIIGFRSLNAKTNTAHTISNLNKEEGEQELDKAFVVKSERMKYVIKQAKMVAKTSASTLLTGESGVGKEMIAKAIHQFGSRSNNPFVKVNCGAIPDNLLESELFGYKKGAFTGADPKGKVGYFTQAHTGIIFLDEIGELSLSLQVKLLRVLQEKEVVPLGCTQPIKIDVQIIAATNRNLEKMVQEGTFREDLYYRLSVVPIHIPSLKERIEDIPFLTEHFLQKYTRQYGKNVYFTVDALELMTVHPWHGNVRELENTIERIVVTAESEIIGSRELQPYLRWKNIDKADIPVFNRLVPLQTALDEVENQLLEMAMKQYNSIKLAAKALQISQPTMSRKYKKLKEQRESRRAKQVVNEAKIFEKELDKQLKSIAIVTAASLNSDDIKQLQKQLSEKNPYYQKLQKKLTAIRQLEGKIEWNYIWMVKEDGTVINMVTDQKLKMRPGEEYKGPPEMMKVIQNAAVKGKAGVTCKYIDKYGEWKSSIAPIKDEYGNVIAILGSDFSVSYISQEIHKLKKMLKPSLRK
jgi:transcriptional regulator with PAS, ATPase and Fis domain